MTWGGGGGFGWGRDSNVLGGGRDIPGSSSLYETLVAFFVHASVQIRVKTCEHDVGEVMDFTVKEVCCRCSMSFVITML